jgi:hypothetical protein
MCDLRKRVDAAGRGAATLTSAVLALSLSRLPLPLKLFGDRAAGNYLYM